MLDTNTFGEYLKSLGFRSFAGVPCSYLAPLINYAINENAFIIANNEGDAVAIASGISLCGSEYGVVLMQNSGLSNALSPLTSLNHTFSIPILGFVSLRGERNERGENSDEPQHELLGVITDKLLEICEIPYLYLDSNFEVAKEQLEVARRHLKENRSFFFIVRGKTFSKVELKLQGHSSLGMQCDRFSKFQEFADHKSSSPLKFAKNSHSHTANIRMLGGEDSSEMEAVESNLDSSMDFTLDSKDSTDSTQSVESNNINPHEVRTLKACSGEEGVVKGGEGATLRLSRTPFSPFEDRRLESDKLTRDSKKLEDSALDSTPKPTRLSILELIHKITKDEIILASTGKCGRELYEIGDRANQLYMVGSMGCVSSLGLGISLKCDKKVIAIDGDSALLMRLGALSTNAFYAKLANKGNFCHILLDNESNDSTGGQDSLSPFVDFISIAKACGYSKVYEPKILDELERRLKEFVESLNSNVNSKDSIKEDSTPLDSNNPTTLTQKSQDYGATFIYIKIAKGSKKDLGRPKITPREVANRLREFIKNNTKGAKI